MLDKRIVIISAAALLFMVGASFAQKASVKASVEQMNAVRACAAKNGVAMPELSFGRQPPPQFGAESGNVTPPPRPPELSASQKAIVDECFKEAGMTPPPPSPLQQPNRGVPGKAPNGSAGEPPAGSPPPGPEIMD